MSVSQSHLSYGDCYKVMDEALSDTHGVRVSQPDMNACTFFRMRLHQARAIDRRRNQEVFQEGDALYGTSQYDPLVVRIRIDEDDNHWVYVEKSEISLGRIEPLSEVTQTALPPPPRQILLAAPETIAPIKRRI